MPAATELPPAAADEADEQTGRATQEDCSSVAGRAETDQQQQQQQQQQLEHAEEQADKLTPLPTAATGTGEATEEQPATTITDRTHIDEGSISGEQVVAEVAEELHTQGEEQPHEQRFNRLDPSRRSFSSPSVNLLQQPSIGRTIFGRLAKAADKQQAAAARSTRVKSAAGEATGVEKLRRRTALGLIPLVNKNNTGESSPSSSTSWRNWLFQQNNPRFSLRCAQKQVNRSSATGRHLGKQQQQSDEHVESNNRANNNQSPANSNKAEPEFANSKHATGQRRHWSSTAQTTAGCLSMKTIKGCEQQQQQADKQAESEKQETRMMSISGSTGGGQSLVDRLIDSQLDWRQLIRDANGGEQASLGQLSELQIKRQEVIHELVQTERHHCLTLALMRQVYLAGARRLNESRASFSCISKSSQDLTSSSQQQQQDLIDLERLFPALEDLIQAHELFFAHLRLRLLDSCTAPRPFLGFVGPIGDLLCEQFRLNHSLPSEQRPQQETQNSSSSSKQQTNGQKLLQAYGKFCGSHFESSKYYKQLMCNDKGFRQFIESCNKQNAACRQRELPDCNLLVTQRLTKYPLLLEQLIKTSKDEPRDEQEKLAEALRSCKCLLAELNQQLARKESFERLLDIYAHFCPKSYTIVYNRPPQQLRFTKHDLLQQHKRVRQLVHCDGQVRIWSATRRKLFQVLCLILNDIIVFLRFESSASQLEPHPLESAADSLSLMATNVPTNSSCAQSHSLNGPNQSNHHQSQNQQQQQQQQEQQQQPSQQQFRYYFANIDNKSSVISLSKLLIREKAAHEQEPRVYLISSNPRQPEMYELAFVSKRHQSGFVEKLKQCIEQHNKRLFEDEDDFECESQYYRSDHDDEMVELNLEDCDCCAICSQHGEDEEEESDLEVGLLEAARRGSPSRANCRSIKSKSLRQKKQQEQQRRRDTIDGFASAALLSGSASSCGDGDGDGDERAEEASSFVVYTGATAAGEPQQQRQDSRSSEHNNSEDSQDDEAAGRKRLESSAAADSGLSERAKDSLDEAAPSRQQQKVRGANRRRRAQRPRNVSNQSSSSSEAAHRQAIELISVCKQLNQRPPGGELDNLEDDEFDSGRGHDDSCSSSCSSSGGGGGDSLETTDRPAPGEGAAVGQLDSELPCEHEEDAGRPRASAPTSQQAATKRAPNQSSSACCNSSAVDVGCPAATCSAAPANGQQPIKSSSITPKSSSCSSSSCCCCGERQAPTASAKQPRKLSNVSSVSSSQLKLISRLKSGLEQAASNSSSLARRVSQSSGKSCQHKQHTCDTTATTAPATTLLSKQMRQQLRRSSFVPEQKLEELRDLRIQLDKDKQEWQLKFNRMQEQLLNERRELDLAREKLKLDRQQVASEREQLYRKLDALKEKGILLSPSHKVIITASQSATLEQTAAATGRLMAGPGQAHCCVTSLAHNGSGFFCPQVHVQQQQPYLQSAAAMGQPLVSLARQGNNSIRIHQPHHNRQQQPQQQPVNAELMPPRHTATANQVATTNLFIQSSRVPLLLSENSPPAQQSVGPQQPRQSTLSKVATPLISVIGNNLFGAEKFSNSNNSATSQQHASVIARFESNVI